MGNYHAEVLRGERGGNAPDLPGADTTRKFFLEIPIDWDTLLSIIQSEKA